MIVKVQHGKAVSNPLKTGDFIKMKKSWKKGRRF